MPYRTVALAFALTALLLSAGCSQGPDAVALPQADRLLIDDHTVVVDERFGRTRLVVYATGEAPRLLERRVIDGAGLGVALVSHRGKSLHHVFSADRLARIDYTGADDAVVRLLALTDDPRRPGARVGLVQIAFAIDDGYPERYLNVVMEPAAFDPAEAKQLMDRAKAALRSGTAADLAETLGRLRNMAVGDIGKVQALTQAANLTSADARVRSTIDRYKEDLSLIARARADEARQRDLAPGFQFLFGVGIGF